MHARGTQNVYVACMRCMVAVEPEVGKGYPTVTPGYVHSHLRPAPLTHARLQPPVSENADVRRRLSARVQCTRYMHARARTKGTSICIKGTSICIQGTSICIKGTSICIKGTSICIQIPDICAGTAASAASAGHACRRIWGTPTVAFPLTRVPSWPITLGAFPLALIPTYARSHLGLFPLTRVPTHAATKVPV
jgi:hypothetical protein